MMWSLIGMFLTLGLVKSVRDVFVYSVQVSYNVFGVVFYAGLLHLWAQIGAPVLFIHLYGFYKGLDRDQIWKVVEQLFWDGEWNMFYYFFYYAVRGWISAEF